MARCCVVRLPGVQDQDRLVEVGILNLSAFGWGLRRTVLTDYPDVVRASRWGMPSLEGLASFTESDVAVTLPQPRSLQAAFVSPNYFDVLGVRPEIGRTFAPEEGRIECVSGGGYQSGPVDARVRRSPFSDRTADPGGRADSSTSSASHHRDSQARLRPGGRRRPLAADRFHGSAGDGRSDGSSGRRLHRRPTRPGKIRYVGRLRDGVGVGRVETELGVVAPARRRSPWVSLGRADRRVFGRPGGTVQGRGFRSVEMRNG